MPLDDRTTNRSYKLPNPANFLSDDVGRLRDALTAIDADVAARPTQAQVDALITGIINGAPGALNTLQELAAALGNDPNFATTITTALANRYTKAESDARYVQGVNQVENLFTGTGSQTVFTLSQAAASRESVLLSVGGVIQPVANYSVTGTTLTLSEAPALGVSIRALLLGVTGPAISAATLNYNPAPNGSLTRSVQAKLRDFVSVLDFGAVADGVTDCTTAINNALVSTEGRCKLYLPAGDYAISERLLVRHSNIEIEGAGVGATRIICKGAANYQAIDIRTSAANNFSGGNLSNIAIRNLTIDGGKATRTGTTGGNGIFAYCDSAHLLSGITIDCVEVINCPAAGILLSGRRDGANNAYKVQSVVIQGCTFTGNNRPGIEQTKVFDTRIIGNLFYLNGLENLTIDVYTWSCIVLGNRFGAHLGGTGNIGIDSGDFCVISSNIVDNQSNTTAGAGYRAGISLNSQLSGGQGCNSVVISGNVIQNCPDYGLIVRDDSGEYFGASDGFTFNGEKAGGKVTINANVFTNNGVDLRIEDGVAPTIVKGNDLQTVQLAEPDTTLVQLETGMVAYEAHLTGDQLVAVVASDTNWKTVQLNQIVRGRLCTLQSYSLVLPVSGFYHFSFKVRFEGAIPLGGNTQFLSAGLKQVVPGDSQAGLFYIANIDRNQASLDLINEINGSTSYFLPAGEVQLCVRVVTSQAQSVSLKLYDTVLSGFLVS